MEDKNSKQKEFWSGKGGDYWVVKQNEMDIMLNPLGEKALAKLNLKADDINKKIRTLEQFEDDYEDLEFNSTKMKIKKINYKEFNRLYEEKFNKILIIDVR